MLSVMEVDMDQNNPNTHFGSLIRAHKDDFEFIGRKDRRMRFNNAKDPIYYVFDVVENRPLQAIAKDFVKDSFSEIANFISKAVR
jgi:hypothetical protein